MKILWAVAQEIWRTFGEMAPYLLLGLTFAGILHVLFKKETIAKHLGKRDFWSVFKAAILGIPLPLCSCGVIPTGLSLRKSNASEGATLSFLISTPQTGIDSIIATYGMLGPVFAIFRPLAALFMGVFGGVMANVWGSSVKDGSPAAEPKACGSCSSPTVAGPGLLGKLSAMVRYAYGEFLDDISVNIVIGIVISGLISFFLPDEFFSQYVGAGLVSMLLMIVVGIPLYVCATASIPIAAAMMMKGLDPGAAFVFLAVGPATNAATITIITRVMGKKITAIYLATIAVSAMIAGLILNAIWGIAVGSAVREHIHQHHEAGSAWYLSVSTYFFLLILVLSLGRRWWPKGLFGPRASGSVAESTGTLVLSIEGMTCNRCAAHVSDALESLEGVDFCEVNIAAKTATIRGTVEAEGVCEAIRKAGYTVRL